MKCLDLFSGTRSIAKAFKIKGFETFTIELDHQHKNIVLFSFYSTNCLKSTTSIALSK